jgi:DNA-binding CsgD family transcriptional regulator
MKPIDQDDRRFLSAAAPHIAQGLHTANLINAPTYPAEPGTSIGGPGVIVMNRHGKILGLDQEARSVFLQLAMHEKLQWSAFAEPQLHSLLHHIAGKLREVFNQREASSDDSGLPSACILSHRAGIVLRLTGHATPGDDAQGLFVVLVEQIEPAALAQTRLIYRHGLAPREAQILVMLQRGTSVAFIGTELGISTGTAKTYVRNLIEKLDASNLRTLRMGLQGRQSGADQNQQRAERSSDS